MSLPDDKRAAAAQGMLHAWWAARIPDRLAVISPHGDRTYEDLNHEINRLARALRARGLEEGDAIALMCTNRPEFLETLYAAQRIGLRLTPINWHLTGEEASYIIENCGAKAFVCSGELGERVVGAAEGGGPGLVKINTGGYLPGFEMYNSVVAEEDGSDIEDPVMGTQMLYTSGTTGRPKGVHRATAATSALA
ncbi:MAG TPA: AMP-binding protein, partial [Acidimicrobiales bacterium]|nr:AMP-binding protein [Acidimicrobiales bacterium]